MLFTDVIPFQCSAAVAFISFSPMSMHTSHQYQCYSSCVRYNGCIGLAWTEEKVVHQYSAGFCYHSKWKVRMYLRHACHIRSNCICVSVARKRTKKEMACNWNTWYKAQSIIPIMFCSSYSKLFCDRWCRYCALWFSLQLVALDAETTILTCCVTHIFWTI